MIVTGANRGLGLEFCRQWLEAGHRVFALCRNPDAADDLRELESHATGSMLIAACDVADDDSVAAAAEAMPAGFGDADVLLNNAGFYPKKGGDISDVAFDDIRRAFEINTLGPLRVLRAFLPRLEHAGARAVQITSLMGSIEDNGSGGSYGYRLSKAALNMLNRNLGHELGRRGIVAVALHPGWVATDMGGAGAPLGTSEAVAEMIATIARLALADSGRFVDRAGKPLPW